MEKKVKGVSKQLTNILAIALDNDEFRKRLISNPEATLKKSQIPASREDIEMIRQILEESQYDVERLGCIYNMECGYRGF